MNGMLSDRQAQAVKRLREAERELNDAIAICIARRLQVSPGAGKSRNVALGAGKETYFSEISINVALPL